MLSNPRPTNVVRKGRKTILLDTSFLKNGFGLSEGRMVIQGNDPGRNPKPSFVSSPFRVPKMAVPMLMYSALSGLGFTGQLPFHRAALHPMLVYSALSGLGPLGILPCPSGCTDIKMFRAFWALIRKPPIKYLWVIVER